MYHTVGQRWDDNWGPLSSVQKWPGLLLHNFPRDIWHPSALQVSTLTCRRPLILQAHRELLHGCHLILCQPDKIEWEELESMGSFRMLFDFPRSRKICWDKEVKCDKCYQPWELCSLLGCLDLLLFHNAFKRGETKREPRGVYSNTRLFSQVDMEITGTLLQLGLKICFLTKHFKITHSIRLRFSTWIIEEMSSPVFDG